MKEPVVQKYDFGCAIACLAFVLDITYDDSAKIVGAKQAGSNRFYVKDLLKTLNDNRLSYESKHIKPKIRSRIYEEGVIVLIRRSRHYPSGHYLIRHKSVWMDPWINLPYDKDIINAKAGYRKRLPGNPMYALLPK